MNKVLRGPAIEVLRAVLRRQRPRTATTFQPEELEVEEDEQPDLLDEMEGRRRRRRRIED